MRLVIQSEEEKRSVLTECHNNPGTGNHSGVRSTKNRVIAGYYWSTIVQDAKDWVMYCRGITFSFTFTSFCYTSIFTLECLFFLPPLIVRYLFDLEVIFIVITNLCELAVFIDILFKKIFCCFLGPILSPLPVK